MDQAVGCPRFQIPAEMWPLVVPFCMGTNELTFLSCPFTYCKEVLNWYCCSLILTLHGVGGLCSQWSKELQNEVEGKKRL